MAQLRAKRVGYFGKVPPTGDFVSRNLDSGLKEGFDRWLALGLENSRAQLSENWLNSFLTAPLWRFLLDRQFDGGKLVAGIMMPSVDKVGRYFPFSVLVELESAVVDGALLTACDRLLEQFEDLLLSALSEEFDLDYFDYQIGMAARKLVGKEPEMANAAAGRFEEMQELDRQLAALKPSGGSVWWTDGAEHRRADILINTSMPESGAFAALLRDADAYRDLEMIWDRARGLGLTQSGNLSTDFSGVLPGMNFHLISHHGRDQTANTAFAGHAADLDGLFLTDGRFGTIWQAMAGRCLWGAMNLAWDGSAKTFRPAELERVARYLSEKLLIAGQSNLLPPLSFAFIAVTGQGEVSVFVSGDYVCFHKTANGVSRVFGAHAQPDGPTIRHGPDGQFRSVALSLSPGERVLAGNALFDFPQISADIAAALDEDTVEKAAKAAFQNAAIRGLSGNVALAVLELTAA